MQHLKKTRIRGALVRTGFLRGVLAASSVAALVVAASPFAAQPGRAESATPSKADECLARPKGAPPRGSHWFYRRDRSTGKRCWFLGPETTRVRRAEPAARRASAEPASPPPPRRPLPRPVEATAPEAPPAVASAPNTAVAATQFSAQWPAPSSAARTIQTYGLTGQTTSSISPSASRTVDPARADATRTTDAPTNAVADNGTANEAAATVASAAPTESAAAARSSAPPPALGQLLIFFAASVAFVAIAFRMTLKLSAAWLSRRRRRMRMRPAPAFVRPPAPARPPFDYGDRTARAPEWLRPHVPAMHTAMPLESIERPMRRPLVADDPPLQADELPPPRRRAVA